MAAQAASALLQSNTPSKQGMERDEGGKRDAPWSGVGQLARRGLEPNRLRTDEAAPAAAAAACRARPPAAAPAAAAAGPLAAAPTSSAWRARPPAAARTPASVAAAIIAVFVATAAVAATAAAAAAQLPLHRPPARLQLRLPLARLQLRRAAAARLQHRRSGVRGSCGRGRGCGLQSSAFAAAFAAVLPLGSRPWPPPQEAPATLVVSAPCRRS